MFNYSKLLFTNILIGVKIEDLKKSKKKIIDQSLYIIDLKYSKSPISYQKTGLQRHIGYQLSTVATFLYRFGVEYTACTPSSLVV